MGMEEPTPRADAAVANPPLHTLLLAITAPFGVMVLLASPLLIDALRHTAGI
jgi:hypothetical protein